MALLHFDKLSAERAIETMGFSQTNRKFARYWLSAWNDQAPPSRKDLNPAKMKDLLPGLAIVEYRPDGSAICRLAGSAIVMAVGLDPTGLDVIALTPQAFREERLTRYRCVAAGAISRCVRRLLTRFDETILVEDVQLPLSATLDGAMQILYHGDWRPQTLDRSRPEILRGLGMVVDEAVSIVLPEALRAAG